MNTIIELAKLNLYKDFSFEGNNYFADIDSDGTMFITIDKGYDYEVLIDGIEL